jgi:hypothetical protein
MPWLLLDWTGSTRMQQNRDDLLRAQRLDPHSPLAAPHMATIAAAYHFEGNYIAAVETARRSLVAFPSYAPARRCLVAGLGQLRKQEEAAVTLQELLAVAPDVFDTYVRNRLPYVPLKCHAHILDGVRKEGWRGCSRMNYPLYRRAKHQTSAVSRPLGES